MYIHPQSGESTVAYRLPLHRLQIPTTHNSHPGSYYICLGVVFHVTCNFGYEQEKTLGRKLQDMHSSQDEGNGKNQ